jgi:hypothetical protein
VIRRLYAPALLASLALAAGCFDSLIESPCSSGYDRVAGQCVSSRPDAGSPDGPDTDAPDPGPICMEGQQACDESCVDPTTDPNHCGVCNHVCQSGICTSGSCAGTLVGHIIAIGHDYQSQHLAMARVLGNSIALGAHTDVGIVRLRGSASSPAYDGTALAIAHSMAQLGRPWHIVPMPRDSSPLVLRSADVLVVEAQTGSGAAAHSEGATWASALDEFLHRGGVAIVLEGAGGVSHRFAHGANLFSVGTPIEITGQPVHIADPTDSITLQVVSPYLAETTSVTFPDAPPGAIATQAGATVVFHTTRN